MTPGVLVTELLVTTDLVTRDSASEVLQKVLRRMSAYVGQPFKPGELELRYLHELRQELSLQAELRGIQGSSVLSMASEVSLQQGARGHWRPVVPGGWEERLDRLLLNRLCRRCASLVTSGSHGPEECDLALVRGIVES